MHIEECPSLGITHEYSWPVWIVKMECFANGSKQLPLKELAYRACSLRCVFVGSMCVWGALQSGLAAWHLLALIVEAACLGESFHFQFSFMTHNGLLYLVLCDDLALGRGAKRSLADSASSD